jgi:NAD(P)H-nitrite reductase large subunit
MIFAYETADKMNNLDTNNSENNRIICFCSDLSLNEITNAVSNGCCTIAEVRNFTNKNITGNCKEKNPMGICCHKEFEMIINQAINLKNKYYDKK